MKEEIERETNVDQIRWAEVFEFKRPLIIGFGLLFFQAGTGVNSVIFYSTKIFGFAGVSQSILATVSVGVVNVCMTLVSVILVDRLGRRSLLLIGTGVMVFALTLNGIVLLTLNGSETVQGYLAVFGTLLYVTGFAVGLGAVAWVIMQEVVPGRIRGKAGSLFIGENFLINILISLLTLTAIEGLGGGSDDDSEKRGVAILFLIFALISFLAFVFIYIVVPETKGKQLEEVQQMLGSTSSSRDARINGDGFSHPLLPEPVPSRGSIQSDQDG